MGLKNNVITSMLKRKLLSKFFRDCLFDSSLIPALYYKTYDFCISYPFLSNYLIEKFILTSCPCDICDCLILFIKKWAAHYKDFDFLFEELLDIADQIRSEFYSMD